MRRKIYSIIIFFLCLLANDMQVIEDIRYIEEARVIVSDLEILTPFI